MPPRFYTSPYKNALATAAKKDSWFTELPSGPLSSAPETTNAIKCTLEYFLVPSSSAGSLLALEYGKAQKYSNAAPAVAAAGRAISVYEVTDDLLAAGCDDGSINVSYLPILEELSSSAYSSQIATLPSAGSPITTLTFNPTTSNLLLSSSGSSSIVHELGGSSFEQLYTLDSAQTVYSAAWSPDGTRVSTTSKAGKLLLFDPRASTSAVGTLPSHGLAIKPSQHSWLSSNEIVSTGFSKTRDREFMFFDVRSPGAPVKTERLDSGTGVLFIEVDRERKIAYLAGKGDQTLRSVLLDSATPSISITQLPAPVTGLARAPEAALDVMQAEINRLLVLSSAAEVIPVQVQVPRRTYLDFYPELFPQVPVRQAAQTSAEWNNGESKLRGMEDVKPGKKWSRAAGATSTAAPAAKASPAPVQPVSEAQPPVQQVKASAPPAVASTPSAPAPEPASATPTAPATPAARPSPAAKAVQLTPSISTPPTPSAPVTSSSTTPAAEKPPPPSARAAPVPAAVAAATSHFRSAAPGQRWSRKFLAGKTALKPDWTDVHGLITVVKGEMELLRANEKFLFFPLAGPGGRIAVQKVEQKGRLPTNSPAVVAGSTLVDFVLDPFAKGRVYTAGDEGKINVFEVPEAGIEEDITEAVNTLSDPSMDRIQELKPHPLAKGLLLSASDDRGKPSLRLWDVEAGQVLKTLPLPDAVGISATAWSPDGKLLAVTTKKKTVLVIDPRKDSVPLSTASHDSVRPSRVIWLSPTSFLTTGFSRSASRELILYKLADDGQSVKQVAKELMDVSPAPLFPYYDFDTNILLLYSRGERTCTAFEVQPDETGAAVFTKIPGFDNPTLQVGWAFLPKRHCDVAKVEVLKGLRLTPGTIESVSFTIPRARTEFFQDDVFPPTLDVEMPALSASEWIGGSDGSLSYVNLQPSGMKPLSEAPVTTAVASTRSKITGPVVTESQKQEAYMEKLFQSAKGDGEEEENYDNRGTAPDDDDW